MSFEAGLISYAALSSLALAVKKHRPSPPLLAMPSPPVARAMGWLLLLAAVMAAVMRFGPEQGVVAWVGQLCAGGAVFVLLLSYRPRLALAGALPALVAAIASLLLW